MIGGDQVDFDKAKDKIDCYSKKMKLLGKAGCGQLADGKPNLYRDWYKVI